METWADPDELVVCPYDPVHRVQRKRLQYHLIKCRKNFYVKDYRQCPFNARHVVPKPEFEYHIQVCEDRCRFEAEQLMAQTQRDPNLKGNTSIPTYDPSWRPDSTESWDDDNVVYVPPSSDGTLISGGRPEEVRRPSPPVQSRPHPPAVLQEELHEFLQPRPPRLEGQVTSQVFRQTMQAQSAPVVGEGRGGAAALVGRGRGRGRGRGIISALAPGTVAVGRNMQGVVSVPASAVAEPPETLEERKKELFRRQRKLQKMLRQIEHLQQKEDSLTEEEVVKVGKKQQILDQLQQLKEAGIGE